MKRYRYLVPSLILALVLPSSLWAAAEGRVLGTVIDENKQPMQGVQVTVTTPELQSFKVETKTDKKGRFRVIVLDATRPYEFRLEMEGYRPIIDMVKAEVGGVTRRDFTMMPGHYAAGGESREVSESAVAPVARPSVRLYNEGAELFNAGDLAGATAKFEQAVAKEPTLAAGHLALARLHLQQKSYAEAAAAAERVLELKPGELEALRYCYDAYTGMGERDKAKEVLQALKQAEQSSDVAILVYNEGAGAVKEGDLATATAKFQEAVGLDPNLLPAHLALCTIYAKDERWAEAVPHAERVLEDEPGNLTALRVRYEGYTKLGDTEKVGEALEALAVADPEFGAGKLYNRAVELFNAGGVDQAQQLLEQAISLDADHAKSHYMLGLCYVNLGDTAEAKDHLQKFLDMAPDDPDAASAQEMLTFLN
jgi:tetratricopeptide (TPR) repeat protein